MDARSERVARWFEIPILVAALLVVPAIVIEESHAGEPWKTLDLALNWVIWAAFALELVVMLAVVPDRRRWLRGHLLEVVIVLFTPPFWPASLQSLRILRLLRLVRLLPVVRVARRLFTLEGLRFAALITALTAVGGGAAFSAVENRTTWDGVWWAMTTITTVGYGDIRPETDFGRVIAIVVMAVGTGFLALLTAALAQRFLSTEVSQVVQAEANVEAAELGMFEELRAIEERLGELQAAVRRIQQRVT